MEIDNETIIVVLAIVLTILTVFCMYCVCQCDALGSGNKCCPVPATPSVITYNFDARFSGYTATKSPSGGVEASDYRTNTHIYELHPTMTANNQTATLTTVPTELSAVTASYNKFLQYTTQTTSLQFIVAGNTTTGKARVFFYGDNAQIINRYTLATDQGLIRSVFITKSFDKNVSKDSNALAPIPTSVNNVSLAPIRHSEIVVSNKITEISPKVNSPAAIEATTLYYTTSNEFSLIPNQTMNIHVEFVESSITVV